MDWNRKMTLELIEQYKTKPVLWNPEHEHYKSITKRNDAIAEIGDILGIVKDEVDRKIKNLQGQFAREMKKLSKLPPRSDGTPRYESKWFAFDSLDFLKDRHRHNTARRMMYSQTANLNQSQNNNETVSLASSKSPQGSDTDQPLNPAKRFCSVFLNEEDRIEDEFDIAGRKYASDLRRLSEHQRIYCERIVAETIYCARLDRLTEESTLNIYSDEIDIKREVLSD